MTNQLRTKSKHAEITGFRKSRLFRNAVIKTVNTVSHTRELTATDPAFINEAARKSQSSPALKKVSYLMLSKKKVNILIDKC